jgi:lipopolysaccharide transport system permease protein
LHIYRFLLLLLFSGAAISLNAISFFSVLNCSDGDFGTGIGMFISLVTKYRDFSYLIGFGYNYVCFSRGIPMALVKEKCRIMPGSFNTIHWLIETTRYMLLNVGQISDWVILCGDCCLFLVGVLIFNRTEKSFIDNGLGACL